MRDGTSPVPSATGVVHRGSVQGASAPAAVPSDRLLKDPPGRVGNPRQQSNLGRLSLVWVGAQMGGQIGIKPASRLPKAGTMKSFAARGGPPPSEHIFGVARAVPNETGEGCLHVGDKALRILLKTERPPFTPMHGRSSKNEDASHNVCRPSPLASALMPAGF